MKKLIILAAVGTLHLCHAATKPNVIYILADDLGYGDLSCYGQTHFQTPNIDALAAKGMKFTQHYSGSTVCAPSRCTLMTGQHTGHAPVRGNALVMPEGQKPMPEGTFTMAHLFKNSGYATGIFGKWGLGAPGTHSEPLEMGFDRFYGYNCQRQAHHYYPYFLSDDRGREIQWGNFGMERGEYAPDKIQEQTLAFVEANKDQPFFIYYALVQPHAEMFAPEEYIAKYRGKFLPESSYEGTDGGPNFRKFAYGSQPEGHAAFAAMVNVMDDDIGELVAKLEELGLAENTLILFSSDNGPHEEGGHDPAYFNSNGSQRGFKRDLYEGGVHVPMIAAWPGKIAFGTETAQLSAFWDVLPTMAELTRQPVPENVDGVSFLPTLLGKDGQEEHDYLYWEFHEKKGRVAIRQGMWKAVRYDVASDPDSALELYNLSADPKETTNVAEQYPEMVAKLDTLIKSARTASPEPDFNFPIKRKFSQAAMAHEIDKDKK
ncbi:arylsulfatase [Pontiella sulfatireligans]|uniref:Arylsulfatase n=1 Tax=Pontiella sulfatireligans TaxID=2750658 RepID=A0A6C2UMZ9_9BACT|nr:arylsulfatase [Pontiella sulfatireligans]SPS74436.1 sulfatase S1_20 [Kiritimatiellales bacterium]VGO20694.1 Arylsulfatase [Pontiella sulfatireligans]